MIDKAGDKVGDAVDKVLDTAEANTQKVASAVEDGVKSVIDKIDDNKHVKAVLDEVTKEIAEEVNGREFSCSLFGFQVLLRIARKISPSLQVRPVVVSQAPSA